MNTMRNDITRGDTTPTRIGAGYTAILTASGEARLLHPSDDAALPLEKRDIAGYNAHARGKPYLTAVHFNLLEISSPRLFANALTAGLLLPFLTSEHMKLVDWLKANQKHLQRQQAIGG